MKKTEEMRKWITEFVGTKGELRDVQYDEENEVAVAVVRFSFREAGIGQMAIVAVFRGSSENSQHKSYIYRDSYSARNDNYRVSWKKVEIVRIEKDGVCVRLKNPHPDYNSSELVFFSVKEL